MMVRWLTGTALLALAGCAASSLPYTPAQQPAGTRISAAYQLVGDRLRIEIDTDGRRVEEAEILKPDGPERCAQAIDSAPAVTIGWPPRHSPTSPSVDNSRRSCGAPKRWTPSRVLR